MLYIYIYCSFSHVSHHHRQHRHQHHHHKKKKKKDKGTTTTFLVPQENRMIDTFDPSSNRSEYDWRLRVGTVGGSQACPTGVAFQILWKPENKL